MQDGEVTEVLNWQPELRSVTNQNLREKIPFSEMFKDKKEISIHIFT